MNEARNGRHPIRKAELARLLRASPGSITSLIRRGLPILPDGRIDQHAALDWIVSHRSGFGGGWSGGLRGPSLAERAAALSHEKDYPELKELPADTQILPAVLFTFDAPEGTYSKGWAAETPIPLASFFQWASAIIQHELPKHLPEEGAR